MRALVIFGQGDIAELAAFYFRQHEDRQVAAFAVDAEFIKQECFCGRPVVAFEEVRRSFSPQDHDFFVAVSYSKLNKLRQSKVAAAKEMGYQLVSYISPRATLFPDFTCGENCFILEDNTIQPFARIGANVTLWSGNHIGHHSVIEDNCFVASHVVVSGGVRIGQNTFVGVNVTIRDHVTIGQRCVLGAGSLILADAPDESVFSPGATERAKAPSSRLRGI